MLELQVIEGHLIHIIFRNEENGYTVALFKPLNDEPKLTVTGTLMGVQVGENLLCKGKWRVDKKYGEQFQVHNFEVRMPTSKEGIEQYLAAGQVAGIGGVLAKRIVQKFGATTLDILDHEPRRLLEVEGIGKKKLERIQLSWQEQQNSRGIVLFLQKYGISPAFAKKIYRVYGDDSISKIEENPYRLAAEVVGIGFKKADEMARSMDIAIDDPQRVRAGLAYVLSQLQMQGHSCYPLTRFTEEAAQLLSVSMELVEQELGHLVADKTIIIDSFVNEDGSKEAYIWLRALFIQEKNIVTQTQRLLSHDESWLKKIDVHREIERVMKKMGLTLAEQQEIAVEKSLQHKFHIITGGPGTGKSTITKVILGILQQHSEKILLAAPTGRAAKRLAEITGREAATIHSMLSLDFGDRSFLRSRLSEPLQCEVLIVDEASMIDTALMAVLLTCLPDTCKLILVGDVDQLPSVGPGNVLADFIKAEQVAVTRLTEIFRQAVGSRIVMNAHKINNGIFPDISIDKDGDFFFIQERQPDKIAQIIEDLVANRLRKAYSFHPIQDMQVLCPMHKSLIGTQALNQALQQRLNKGDHKKEKAKKGQIIFTAGDKVMQVKNNYEKMVYNGDIGVVKRIKTVDKQLWVEMDDGREVEYEFSDLNELELAYAVTVHKYQGSEAPCIVVPIHESQYRLLFKNLIYTAVTRGKKLVILVGSKNALNMAVKNDRVQKRFSALDKLFDYEHQRAFPEIKIAPNLGDPSYPNWLEEEFPEEVGS